MGPTFLATWSVIFLDKDIDLLWEGERVTKAMITELLMVSGLLTTAASIIEGWSTRAFSISVELIR